MKTRRNGLFVFEPARAVSKRLKSRRVSGGLQTRGLERIFPRRGRIHLPRTPLFRNIRNIVLLAVGAAACDHGLVPPDEPPTGAVRVDITYVDHPESWPPPDSLHDLRFVAMRFVPADTADFLQLNRLVFSQRLQTRVGSESILLTGVEAGPFLYAGVAQKYGPDTFDWRPVGLVTEDGGVFVVRSGDTTRVSVRVDFRHPPLFPPPSTS